MQKWLWHIADHKVGYGILLLIVALLGLNVALSDISPLGRLMTGDLSTIAVSSNSPLGKLGSLIKPPVKGNITFYIKMGELVNNTTQPVNGAAYTITNAGTGATVLANRKETTQILPAGTYTISFAGVSGYTVQAPTNFTLTSTTQNLTLTGFYYRNIAVTGTLTIAKNPSSSVLINGENTLLSMNLTAGNSEAINISRLAFKVQTNANVTVQNYTLYRGPVLLTTAQATDSTVTFNLSDVISAGQTNGYSLKATINSTAVNDNVTTTLETAGVTAMGQNSAAAVTPTGLPISKTLIK